MFYTDNSTLLEIKSWTKYLVFHENMRSLPRPRIVSKSASVPCVFVEMPISCNG
jgi:hypothetical protein